MKNYALACLLGASLTSLLQRTQDPQKAPAPVPAPATAVAAQPGKEPAAANALEGVYELRSRVTDGTIESQRSRGYLAITKRHMMICVVAPGTDPNLPLLRAGVRSWKSERDDLVRTDIRLGFYTDSEGAVHIDPLGESEVKRIQRERGRIRVWQDDRSYLEFERVE
jgi:hypothetical protein